MMGQVIRSSMDEWEAEILAKIHELEEDIKRIQALNLILYYKKVITDDDTNLYIRVVEMIREQIEALKYEILVSKMLESEQEYNKFLVRLDRWEKERDKGEE